MSKGTNGHGIPSEGFPRERKSFDSDWLFQLGDIAGLDKTDLAEDGWRKLNVPHDWSVEGNFDRNNPTGGDGGYLPAGIGCYRKHFHVSSGYECRKAFLEFDGVFMNADVWLNGHFLGHHVYGYTGFVFELTPYLVYGGGDNLLAVRVDNSAQPNSRWYTGSGIYRHTWLSFTGEVHIGHWGTYITTPVVDGGHATVRAAVLIQNESPDTVEAVVKSTVFSPKGENIKWRMSAIEIKAGSCGEHVQSISLENVQLWSVEEPGMYLMRHEVFVEGGLADTYETPFGIRKIEFDPDQGFLLNGSRVKINGVCLHHDGGCVGAAVPENIWAGRLQKLKEMGCNGIRMSHNPPSAELLDLCDRMGFLVMDEAFDEWTVPKEKSGIAQAGYYKYYDSCFEEDLKAMLRRDRNHPSVILWSVGNEIPEQVQPEGAELLKKLIDICHEIDPTRPVTSACDNVTGEPKRTVQEFLEQLDVVGFNYIDRWRMHTETYYAGERHKHPRWKIIGSEHSAIGGIRGDYKMEGDTGKWWWRPYFCSMLKAEQLWKFTRAYDYVAGDYMWTGCDYLGEARWPDKNAGSGVMDLCGFTKDGYYFYQSQWTEKPMLHLFPHWNWKGSEGKFIPVICYTNCEYVELFLNGRSIGKKSYEFPRQGMTQKFGHFDRPQTMVTTSELHLSWDVPYEPGELKAVGMRDGKAVCEQTVETTGNPEGIQLVSDGDQIAADGWSACCITVRILDSKGRIVPVADPLVRFRVEGAGRLIGVDNGRPDSHERFKADSRYAFNGLCLAVVQSTGISGEIRVTAEAEGLEPYTIRIRAV